MTEKLFNFVFYFVLGVIVTIGYFLLIMIEEKLQVCV